MAIGYAAILGPFVYLCWSARLRPSSIGLWIGGYFVLGTAVRAWAILNDEKLEVDLRRLLDGSALGVALAHALLLSGLSFCAFAVTYTRGRKLPAWRPTKSVSLRTPAVAAYFLLGLSVAAGLIQARFTRGVTGGGDFALTFASEFAGPIAAMALFEWVTSRNPRGLPIALFGTAVCLWQTAQLGQKSGLLTLGVVGAVALATRRGQRATENDGRAMRGKRVLAGLVGAALVLAVVVVSFSLATSAGEEGPEAAVRQLVSRTYFVDSVVAIDYYREQGNPPLMGSSFAQTLYAGVPRQLWPSKPVAFSQTFGEEVYWFSSVSGTAFFAPSYPGEWLINFGWIGVVIGWALFGAVARRLQSASNLLLLALVIVACIRVTEGPLASQVWLVAPMFVAYALCMRAHDIGGVTSQPDGALSGSGTVRV